MSGKPVALEVLVFGRTGFVGSYVFSTPKISIGRARDAMVPLNDAAVSLNHAVLLLDGGLYRIKDLGSRTGTRVNGAAILPRQPLEPTDEIAIGPFRLRVTTCEPEPEEDDPMMDEATMRLASMVSGIAPPTAQPFYPPPAPNGGRMEDRTVRARGPDTAPAMFPRGERRAEREAPSRLSDVGSLGESTETTVVRPPPKGPERARHEPARAAPAAYGTPAPPPPAPLPLVIPPPAPLPESLGPSVPTQFGLGLSSPASATRPSNRPSGRPGGLQLDTAREVVPLAFAVPEARGEEAPARDDDDDDEDDDSNFEPPFDLLDSLSRGGIDDGRAPAAGSSFALEIIHHRGGRILSVRHPRTRGPLRLLGTPEVIGAVERDGTVTLQLSDRHPCVVRENGRTYAAADLLAKGRGPKLRIDAGMQARIDLGGEDRVLVHWVPRAFGPPLPPISLRPNREGMTAGGMSVALHIATLLFIGLVVFGDNKPAESDINAGRFATISTKELELEPPPPPPPPEEVPTAEVVPNVDIPQMNKREIAVQKSKVTTGKHNQKASDSAQANATGESSAAASKILSALGGAPSTASAISVTNLDALPAGAGSFKVSGSVGKAPGDTLRVAAAGATGKDVDTKSASELGGNNLGRVQGQAAGTGQVRARVTATAQAVRGEGHLDRGEIQKVVNAHLYQVQGCYERQLAKDPSLSGKISYEWDVGTTGSVSNVRVGRSSVHSVEVTTCIQSAIQGWKFPAPQGGSVTVTYPFAFSALGG